MVFLLKKKHPAPQKLKFSMKKNSIFTQEDQPASQKIEVLRKKMTSQFRGIAEVVKEFIEYIADSPLLGQNA